MSTVRALVSIVGLALGGLAGAGAALAAGAAVATYGSQDVSSYGPGPRSFTVETVKAVEHKSVQPRKRLRRNSLSVASKSGLRETPDPLELSSSVAYMVDQDTGEVYFEKNAYMTALVIAQSELPLKTKLKVTRADYVKSTADSKLRSGMVLTREDTLRAALMSSDNRAAHMLARTYPGGVKVFVEKMNETARELGMHDSHFTDPTGLSNENVSTAHDLAILAARVHEYPFLAKASTGAVALINTGASKVSLMTTNRLIGDPRWKVGLQKTGYTRAAGRCMVVQSEFAGHRVVMVVLDSETNGKRANDMLKMRRWLEDEVRFEDQFANVAPFALM